MRNLLSLLLLFTTVLTLAAPPRFGAGTCPSHVADVPRWNAPAGGPRRTVGVRALFPRVLVIMANFSDYSFVSSKAEVDSMFNAVNWTQDGATGSVRRYFYDQSAGAYNPQFDVVGPVTLSQGYAYYGAGQNTSAYPGHMVTEACALVDDSVDFTQYDLNDDGMVDLVFVLYAGFGENDPPQKVPGITASNLVWPHYSSINRIGCGTNTRIFDGVTINDYECANELDGLYSTSTRSVVAGIGVMVHEFCHGLGLPDLYMPGSRRVVGRWSVLDYGPYNNDMHTPPALSTYERWYMGWMQPEQLLMACNDTLAPLSEVNEGRYFTPGGDPISSGTTPSLVEFYLLENRQKTGWDIAVPDEGLLLWHVCYDSDSWSRNNVNTSTRKGVDIVRADGLLGDAFGKQGDCYPYAEVDSIVVVPTLPITHITRQSDGTVTYQVGAGADPGPTTSCPPLTSEAQSRKVLINGHLYILRRNAVYTTTGLLLR